MTKRLKTVILIIAITLLIAGVALLAYVYWPIPVVQFHETVSPTLLASPP